MSPRLQDWIARLILGYAVLSGAALEVVAVAVLFYLIVYSQGALVAGPGVQGAPPA